MASSKTRFFFRSLLVSYSIVGYGIPIGCTLYHSTLNSRYNGTKQAFQTKAKAFTFPFYFERTNVENQLRNKLEKNKGEFIFIYGKPYVGKSTLIRHICSKMSSNGVFKTSCYSFQPFHKTFAKRLRFTFNEQWTWTNLLKHIYFPLSLCTLYSFRGTAEEQLNRTLNHLQLFVENTKHDNHKIHPYILIIDDAENLTKEQFTLIYTKCKGLIARNLLTVCVISSDPQFSTFISSNSKFKSLATAKIPKFRHLYTYHYPPPDGITRFQINEMSKKESLNFLESQPSQLFINRMRNVYEYSTISQNKKEQMKYLTDCYNMAGGIPLWLLQCAIKSPSKWYKQRINRVKSIINKLPNHQEYYNIQSFMMENNKSSLQFNEFINIAGGIQNTINLLHSLPRNQRINRIFFHDLKENQISLQYEYLKKHPLNI